VYRILLDSGHTPEDWKASHVTPIYKTGPKHDPGNYRPVSLTSVACKVFEALVKDAMVTHLDRNGLITDCQHGFVLSCSCATNLIEFYDNITLAMDNNKPTDIIFLELAKAFDKVPHRALVAKLRSYGIQGKVGNWVESWLSNRKKRVVINVHRSVWKEILWSPTRQRTGPHFICDIFQRHQSQHH